MASREERRRRITDLYTEGEVLQAAPGQMVFIKKLNQFEDGEARADAMAARSRTVMAQRNDTPEAQAMHAAIAHMEKSKLVDGILASRYTKYMADASTAIQTDPEWAERLLVLDRTDRDRVREDEVEVINKINSDYLTLVSERATEFEAADRDELMSKDDDDVRRLYEDTVIETRAAAVYIGEYKFGQIAWAARMCDAEQPMDGGDWDHSKCKHERLYVDEEVCGQGHVVNSRNVCSEEGCTDPDRRTKRAVEFVREEPDGLLDEYVRVLDRVHLSMLRSKGSASRQSSSEPSRQPSEEEASTPSTPEVTSSEPVATSA